MRLAIVLLVLLGTIAGGYQLLSAAPERDIAYVTAPVVNAALKETVTSSGTLTAVVTVEVGSQLSGQISSLHADFNDTVSKGDRLAVLDQQSYQARLSEARAALEMAKATILAKTAEMQRAAQDLDKTETMKDILEARLESARASFAAARADLERKEKLASNNTVTGSTLDEGRAKYRSAAADVKEAETYLAAHAIDLMAAEADLNRQKAELDIARARVPEKEALLDLAHVELERTTVRAPIDGIIINRNVDEGQTVAASLEAPTLFTIAQDLTEMELHARVDETDIGKISLGQKAVFRVDAFPQERFTGEVAQIRKSPTVIQNIVTYTVVIHTSNPGLLLLPGMTALLEITVMESDTQLLVPSDALRYDPSGGNMVETPDRPQVWRLTAGQPEKVEIGVGRADASNTIVTEGDLKEGDEVVVREIQRQRASDSFLIRLGF